MAAPIVQVRRSSVAGKIPTTSQLAPGEFGINTYDGKIYIEQDQGAVGVGTTVIVVNPWSVGLGSTAYNTYFTAGNVGVGNTDPIEKLHVTGNTLVDNDVTADRFYGKFYGTSNYNFFGGVQAGLNNSTGISNVFIGAFAGYENTTGTHNTFVGGEEPGYCNTIGRYNSFFGAYAGYYNTTGYYNNFFGTYNGISTSASYKVIIGSGRGFGNAFFDCPDTDKDIQFAVGVNTDVSSKYWLVGNENFDIGIGTTNPTTKLEVGGTVKATSFIGDGSGLTGVTASGTAISVQNDGVSVGSATTINFADNLSVTFSGNVARVSGFSTTAAGILKTDTQYTATAGQTTFTATYVVGYVDVYLNGVRLSGSEYTATNGTSIILNEGASLGDIINIVAFSVNLTSVTNSTNVIGGIGSITQLSVSGVTTSGRFISTAANNTANAGGQIYLNGANGNRVDFNTNGVAAPSFTTRSVGTKITLYPDLGGSTVDYAIGIDNFTLWNSVPTTTNTYQHRWYGGTTQLMDLKGSGELVLGSSTLTGTASQRLQVTGNAYVSGNLGIGTTNPSSPLEVTGEITSGRVNTTQEGGQINFKRAIDNAIAYSIDCYNDVGLGLTARLRFIDNVAGSERLTIDKAGNIIVGSGTSTGTTSQLLQVNSGGYFSGDVGIAITNPTANLHVGAATTSAVNNAPLKINSGGTANLLATPEAGALEYDGTNFYITPNASTLYGRAAVPLTIYNSGSGTTGITGSTNYAMFPAASDTITLAVGTYAVRIRFRAAVAGSTTSGTMLLNLRGAGNAVGSFSWGGTGAILDEGIPGNFLVAATALGTAFNVTPASVANPRQYSIIGEGILKVTTQGTIIPAYQYSATLTGGTTTLVADNHMIIQSLDTRSNAAFGPVGSGWG